VQNELLAETEADPLDLKSSSVSLYELVHRLQLVLLPQAVEKSTFIVNHIDRSLALRTDEDTLAFIVGSLMNSAVSSTSNGCIQIETVYCDSEIQIRIKNNGVFFYSSPSHSLGHVADAARKLGGSINLYNNKYEGMIAVFSFSKENAA
jgi:hypothetical protein